jgi:hypothetical protein
VAQREKSKELLERTAGDTTSKSKKKKKEEDAPKKRPVFAAGGLDQDLYSWGGGSSTGKTLSKKKLKLSAEKEFTDFDPTMRLRKGGKKGHSSFKSKAKFKRRK